MKSVGYLFQLMNEANITIKDRFIGPKQRQRLAMVAKKKQGVAQIKPKKSDVLKFRR